MKKTITKAMLILFALSMMFTTLTPNKLQAQESSANFEYKIPKKVMPYIYYAGSMINTSADGRMTLPEGITQLYLYFLPTVAEVDENTLIMSLNGQDVTNITWSNSGSYRIAQVDLPFTMGKNTKLKADIKVLPKFNVRARKIAVSQDKDKIEAAIKDDPTQYKITNEDGSIVLNGSANTTDTMAPTTGNFVQWEVLKGNINPFKNGDNTRVWNLPNGKYKLIETYGGSSFYTNAGKRSSFNYFNASHTLKTDENNNYYYSFEINDALVETFMNDVLNNQQGNSVFFGFYTEMQKYSLSYNGNGASSGSINAISDKYQGEQVEVADNVFIRDGYEFLGFNIVATPTLENPGVIYQSRDMYTFANKNETLFAQWRKIKHVQHEVFVNDAYGNTSTLLTDLKKILTDSNDFAYTSEELETAAKAYIINNEYPNEAYYNGYQILIKESNGVEWVEYQQGMEFEDDMQVRYVLNIGKEEEIVVTPPITPITPVTPLTPILPITPNTVLIQQPNITQTPTEIENNEVNNEVEKVDEKKTPKANLNDKSESWALINLIATLITVLLALFILIAKHQKEDEDEETNEDDEKLVYKRHRYRKVLCVAIAIISVVLFVLTEDITLPIALSDKWTIWMIVIAVVQVCSYLYARKFKQQEETKTA